MAADNLSDIGQMSLPSTRDPGIFQLDFRRNGSVDAHPD
jgi:hypothetical protein